MKIDVFTATGTKKGTLDLPADLFEAPVNQGLMHQAIIRQQSNRRSAIAHAKSRGEVVGSTRKLYAQKHTGRARRGPIRSPLLRGGGKTFGPRNTRNFEKDMPRAMRHAAIRSCLSYQATRGTILGLEEYPQTIKTKGLASLLKKLPVEYGRRILFIMPSDHAGLRLSARNIPGVTTLLASYLNAEDLLGSRHIILLSNAVEAMTALLTKKEGAKLSKRGTKGIEGKEEMKGSEIAGETKSSPKKKIRKVKAESSSSPKKSKKSL